MDVGEQFEIVRNLLARQDEVLQELDALESRVEQILKQFVGNEEGQSEGDSAPQPVAA